MSKMYILIKESVDLGHAVLSAAHASLSGYLTFKDDPAVEDWVTNSFRKVVCMVTDDEFDDAKQYSDHRVMTESSLDDAEVAIVFKPRNTWPDFFKSLRLYNKPKSIMSLGRALTIVRAMGSALYKRYGEIVYPAATPHDTQLALDIVSDFITKEYGTGE